jgi:hypothetical protein
MNVVHFLGTIFALTFAKSFFTLIRGNLKC